MSEETSLLSHGLILNPKPAQAARFRASGYKINGYTTLEEPQPEIKLLGQPQPTTGPLWLAVWLEPKSFKPPEPGGFAIEGFAEELSRQKRLRYLAGQTPEGPICAVSSRWEFLITESARHYNYARLTISFGPPVAVDIPVIFELPAQLQALAAIFSYQKLMFSAGAAGKLVPGEFIFVEVPPTEELQLFLTAQIARMDNASSKEPPKPRLKRSKTG